MGAPRHSWDEPVRYARKTERACRNRCGTVKVTRHEHISWIEYWQPDERQESGWAVSKHAPRCEPVEVPA